VAIDVGWVMAPPVVAEQNETHDEPDDPDEDAEPEDPDGGGHVAAPPPDQSGPATEIKPTSVATRTAAIRVPTPSFR
jgi:hypothetical protein